MRFDGLKLVELYPIGFERLRQSQTNFFFFSGDASFTDRRGLLCIDGHEINKKRGPLYSIFYKHSSLFGSHQFMHWALPFTLQSDLMQRTRHIPQKFERSSL